MKEEGVIYPEVKLLNSDGKKVATVTEDNAYDIKLKKGEYTLTFKAEQTGCLYTEVYESIEW